MLVEGYRDYSRTALADSPLIGLPPIPPYAIPEHLGLVTGDLGNERGAFVEIRTAEIIGVHPKVKEVVQNKKDGQEDRKNHDLTVIFVDESGIPPINVQVKCRNKAILLYRNRIARRLKKAGSSMSTREWLILDRTIPLNGAADSVEEVMSDFVIGVANVIKNYDEVRKRYSHVDLFPADEEKGDYLADSSTLFDLSACTTEASVA